MPPTPPEELYRWVTRSIHPEEAEAIGRRLKLAGMSLDSIAYHIGAIKAELEQSWCGRAQQRFFDEYGFAALPARLEELGAAVEAHGEAVMGITVSITERVRIDAEERS
jgi:uncharacterized protein YukE